MKLQFWLLAAVLVLASCAKPDGDKPSGEALSDEMNGVWLSGCLPHFETAAPFDNFIGMRARYSFGSSSGYWNYAITFYEDVACTKPAATVAVHGSNHLEKQSDGKINLDYTHEILTLTCHSPQLLQRINDGLKFGERRAAPSREPLDQDEPRLFTELELSDKFGFLKKGDVSKSSLKFRGEELLAGELPIMHGIIGASDRPEPSFRMKRQDQ